MLSLPLTTIFDFVWKKYICSIKGSLLFFKTVSVDENDTEKIKSSIFFPCIEIMVALVNTCDSLEDLHWAVQIYLSLGITEIPFLGQTEEKHCRKEQLQISRHINFDIDMKTNAYLLKLFHTLLHLEMCSDCNSLCNTFLVLPQGAL